MNEIKAKRVKMEAECKEKMKEKEEILKKEKLIKEIGECNDNQLLLRKKIE